MQLVISFLAGLEVPIYLIMVIVGVVYLRKLIMGLEERRTAVFGLEREAAQSKVTASVSVLILVGLLTVGEFVLVTMLAPKIAEQASYATPTALVTETPTPTLDPTLIPTDATQTPTVFPQAQIDGIDSACEAGVLEISDPVHDSDVSGVVEIIGSVNTPSIGSYFYDYSTMGEPNWQTIAAGNTTRVDESLGFWYTNDLVPGPYLLRLVALDNEGKQTAACVIVLRVVAEE
ncbi:MAG: hypothetical protein WBI14_08905 [Anaerolineaceae bacterium]